MDRELVINAALVIAVFLLEKWIANNPNIKANSTIDAIINGLKAIMASRGGPFIKTMLALCFLCSFGCAADVTNVQRDAIREMILDAPECETGKAVLGITGHRPDCISPEFFKELQEAGIL